MAEISQDRLVRKEVALGVIRALEPPTDHIGLRLCPWLDVQSDDVVFDYLKGQVAGLAPARAEDAEAEMADKDDFVGTGRASLIDWAIKDHYDPSDVSRYRSGLLLEQQLAGISAIPRFVTDIQEGFAQTLTRDQSLRRRKLDNRVEWLIMTAFDLGVVAYNDGKIVFSVDYGRPSDQHDEAPSTAVWSNHSTANPVADILAIQDFMWTRYSVRMTQAITSRKVLRNAMQSDKFKQISPYGAGNDPAYTIPGWGIDTARAIIEQQTGVRFIGLNYAPGASPGGAQGWPSGTYDSVYRTRPLGSQTFTSTRFTREESLIMLPSPEDIATFNDTQVGFGRTLTAPHPEGNWTPGFYEWEQEKRDPWGMDRGTGVKAFPVLPFMEYTYVAKVL